MLNKKQALELFEREAVCFGQEDGVPLFRVRQMFGEEAAECACVLVKNFGVFEYLIGCKCEYLRLAGFLDAVAQANTEELQKLEQGDPVALFLSQFSYHTETQKGAQS